MSDEQQVRRIVPQNSLDWQAMTTDTMWGSPQISLQLNDRIKARGTNSEESRDSSWEMLSFMTRDWRLGNTSILRGDEEYCEHYTNLAGDLAREGLGESFASSLGRVAARMELSQSRGGFLRRRQNTITSESMTGELDKKKKLLFAGRNKE